MPGIVQPAEWPVSNAVWPGWNVTWPGWNVTEPAGNANHPELRMEFCVAAVIAVGSM